MRFQILTIFPELFRNFAEMGLIGRKRGEGAIQIDTIDLRDFAINAQRQVDDTPYGGGSGMVLRPEPAVAAIEHAKAVAPNAKVVLLSPRGKPLSTATAKDLAAGADAGLIILCCRYEGVDERVISGWVDEEISLGDFILMGGEVASMALIEAVSRQIPGVLGNAESLAVESFEHSMLEHPHYTKPAEFRGMQVPPVLLSGNHAEIEKWRSSASTEETMLRRPDLASLHVPPACELSVALIHYPVLNKRGETIISSITNLDLHDIARSSRTFGLKNFYVVHPTRTLRRLSQKILEHWETGYGSTYNPNRSDALKTIAIMPDFDDVLADFETRTGQLPKIITTSARNDRSSIGFDEMKAELYRSTEPHLILLGTGWGMTDELLERADFHLAPVDGHSGYNHLSVRAAAAIIFDRLVGKQ